MSLHQPPSYDEQRIAWRKSLPELIVRELASDYMRGRQDECTYDAYLEYERRFGKRPPSPRGLAAYHHQ